MSTTDEKKSMVRMVGGYRGVLVIGDPWLGSPRRVGRVDQPWDASFSKLEQALEMARSRLLLPIIAGDLLHEHRDIGQLLPIINLLKRHKPMLMPRKWRWEDRAERHIAAILSAAGIAEVVGKSFEKMDLMFKENEMSSDIETLRIECYTPWGGVETLEPGAQAYLKIPGLNVAIVQGSSLPTIEAVEGDLCVVAGRLLRVSPSEEAMAVTVTAITQDGVESLPLEVKPVVFSSASLGSEVTKRDLEEQSRFVEKLRMATQDTLEEEGKESLLGLIEEVCSDNGADDYIRAKMMELAKEVAAD